MDEGSGNIEIQYFGILPCNKNDKISAVPFRTSFDNIIKRETTAIATIAHTNRTSTLTG